MDNETAFELTDDMLTGIASIDQQHRNLVAILNDASAKLAESHGKAAVERVTKELLAYAIYHFESEEGLIKASGYDVANETDAAVHLREHRRFSEQVVAMRNDLRNGKATSHEVILSFLRDWLRDHILNTDKRLGEYITARNRTRMPEPLS